MGATARFFIGGGENIRYDLLLSEMRNHDDIVYFNLLDAYSNLTLKVAAMMQWQQRRCSDAAHLLKLGQDVMVHLPRLSALISDGFGEQTVGDDWVLGRREPKVIVCRDRQSKS